MDAMTIESMLIVALCAVVLVPLGVMALWRLLVLVVEWSAPKRIETDHVAARHRAVTHRGFKSRAGIRS